MDDTPLAGILELLVLGTFWLLMYSSNRGRLLGIKWSVPQLKQPWRRQVMWAGLAGTTVLLVAIMGGELLPSVALLVIGYGWLAALTCFVTWAVLLDPSKRLATDAPWVDEEAAAEPMDDVDAENIEPYQEAFGNQVADDIMPAPPDSRRKRDLRRRRP